MIKHIFAAFLAILLSALIMSCVYAECGVQKGDLIETKDGRLLAVTRIDDCALIFVRHLGSRLEDFFFLNQIEKDQVRVHKQGTKQYCEKAVAFLKQ